MFVYLGCHSNIPIKSMLINRPMQSSKLKQLEYKKQAHEKLSNYQKKERTKGRLKSHHWRLYSLKKN